MASNNLYKTPLEVKCFSGSGDTTLLLNISANTNTFYIPSTKNITNIQLDPNNWILDSSKVTKNPDLLLSINNTNFEHLITIYPNPTNNIFYCEGAKFDNAAIYESNKPTERMVILLETGYKVISVNNTNKKMVYTFSKD